MPKNKESIQKEIENYTSYFKNDLDAIEEELEKSKEYSQIIDNEIKKLSSSSSSFGPNKGSQHYLIEHISNAVQLQTQRQGLRRDRFTIKKAVLDYASKFADEDSGMNGEDISAIIRNVINRLDNDKASELENPIITEELDDEIDKILNNQ